MAKRNRMISEAENSKRTNHLILAGKRIAQARDESGFTQADLADIMKVSIATISGIECGKNQTIHIYIDIANIINISLDEIFCDCLSNTGKSVDSDISELLINASSRQKNMIRDVIIDILKYPEQQIDG